MTTPVSPYKEGDVVTFRRYTNFNETKKIVILKSTGEMFAIDLMGKKGVITEKLDNGFMLAEFEITLENTVEAMLNNRNIRPE